MTACRVGNAYLTRKIKCAFFWELIHVNQYYLRENERYRKMLFNKILKTKIKIIYFTATKY